MSIKRTYKSFKYISNHKISLPHLLVDAIFLINHPEVYAVGQMMNSFVYVYKRGRIINNFSEQKFIAFNAIISFKSLNLTHYLAL